MKKNLLFFAVAFFSMIAVVLSGCADNLTGNETVTGSGIQGKRGLTIVVSNYEGGKAERTILPDALALDDLTFSIEGKSSTSGTVGPLTITVETDGTAYVPLAAAVWDLTLTASKDGKPVLKGYANANLVSSPDRVRFTMKPYDITTKGNVDLRCTYTYINGVHGEVKSIFVALFDTVSGNMISGTDYKETTINGSFNYNKTALEPGSYYFEVFFLNKTVTNYAAIDEANDVMGYYGDLLIVDPGNTTDKDIAIPDVIGEMPAAPSEFSAYLIDDSEDPDHYNVKFTWKSNSTNERYFKIEIKEYTDASTPKAGEAWKTLDGTNYKTAASDLYVSGNLLPVAKDSKGEFVYKLKTGVLYDATITAVNKFGSKEPVERITTGIVDETGCTAFDSTNSVRINRLAAIYYLKNGTLSTDASTSISPTRVIEYHTYKDANISLKTIHKTAAPQENYPVLVRNGLDFTRWVRNESSDESEAVAVTETDAWRNIEVKAVYESGIEVEIPGYTDLPAARVSAVIESTTTDVKNGANEISENKKIKITVSPAADPATEPEYEKYEVKVNGVSVIKTTSNEMLIDTAPLEGGTYVVNVLALAKDSTQWYTNTFIIKVSK